MTLDLTKPVQTTDGRKARIICVDRKAAKSYRPVVALVTDFAGNEFVASYDIDGLREGRVSSNFNLVNIPEVFYRTYNISACCPLSGSVSAACRVGMENGKIISVELTK